MHRFSDFVKFLSQSKKKHIFISLLLLGGFFFVYKTYFKSAEPVTYTLTKVSRGTIVSSLSATGQVVADSQVDIKPLSSGQVVSIKAKEGDTVKRGDVLAVLDQRSAALSLAQAENNLRSAEASYQKFIKGLNDTDKSLSQTSVDAAKLSLDNSSQNLVDKITTSYNATFDAVSATNVFFSAYTSSNPIFTGNGISFNNSSLRSSVESSRPLINQKLVLWKDRLAGVRADNASIESDMDLKDMQDVLVYLDNLNELLTNYSVSGQSSASISSSANSIASARDSLKNTMTSLRTSKQSLLSAEQNLAQAKLTYTSKTAEPESEDVTSQEVALSNARIARASARNSYDNTIVKAPFDGVVSQVNAHEGEIGSASIATLMTKKKIAEVSVSESDVVKVRVGQKATILVDALPEDTFTGRVISVDSAGTITQGVVTYTVKVAFDTEEESIKANMSVSLNIITSISQDVLMVPSSSLKTKGGDTMVSYVQEGEKITSLENVSLSQTPSDKVVETGVSDDEYTEIISGLEEGEYILLKPSTTSAAAAVKTTQNIFSSLLSGNKSTARPQGASGGMMGR